MDKYHFDDAYEKVYELAEPDEFGRTCYLFYCTYLVCGITAKMSDSKKLQKVGFLENWREGKDIPREKLPPIAW